MEFEGEIIATQSPSLGFETPVTVTVTNWSSDKLELLLIMSLTYGFIIEPSFKILLFINLKSDTAVKFWCKALVCVTTRSKVEENEGVRKKKSKMDTCLRIQFEDSMDEEVDERRKERVNM